MSKGEKRKVDINKLWLVVVIVAVGLAVVGLLMYAIFSTADNTGNILTAITGALIGGAATAFGAIAVWQTKKYQEQSKLQALINTIVADKDRLESQFNGLVQHGNITDMYFDYRELVALIDSDKTILLGRFHAFSMRELHKVLNLRTALERDKIFFEGKLEVLKSIEQLKELVGSINHGDPKQIESKIPEYYDMFNDFIGNLAFFLDRAGVAAREYTKLSTIKQIEQKQELAKEENLKVISAIIAYEDAQKGVVHD